MRRLTPWIAMILLTTALFAGFKAKIIKPKKPEKFQTCLTTPEFTLAADLLLTDKEQKDFFPTPLNANNIVPLRLAIFNRSEKELQVPLEGVRLVAPDGKEFPIMAPEKVGEAVIEGIVVSPGSSGRKLVVAPNSRSPIDRTDPSYDPSDRTDPTYDPRLDPNSPQYDPKDLRNRPYADLPHVGIVFDPYGGNNTEMTRQLIAKDFVDKSLSAEPIPPATTRDRFLYFGVGGHPSSIKGFELRLPKGNGFSEEVVLKF